MGKKVSKRSKGNGKTLSELSNNGKMTTNTPKQALRPLSEFKFFAKLPIELRLSIFAMALPDGQPVLILGEEQETEDGTWQDIEGAKASYKIPALLHTSREARALAQCYYKNLFADRLGGNGVYFDIFRDVLTFADFKSYTGFFGSDYAQWTSIAKLETDPRVPKPLMESLPMIAFEGFKKLAFYAARLLHAMGQPKEIFIVRNRGPAATWEKEMPSRINQFWDDKYSKLMNYEKPDTQVLTYKALREKLKGLGDSVFKKNERKT